MKCICSRLAEKNTWQLHWDHMPVTQKSHGSHTEITSQWQWDRITITLGSRDGYTTITAQLNSANESLTLELCSSYIEMFYSYTKTTWQDTNDTCQLHMTDVSYTRHMSVTHYRCPTYIDEVSQGKDKDHDKYAEIVLSSRRVWLCRTSTRPPPIPSSLPTVTPDTNTTWKHSYSSRTKHRLQTMNVYTQHKLWTLLEPPHVMPQCCSNNARPRKYIGIGERH